MTGAREAQRGPAIVPVSGAPSVETTPLGGSELAELASAGRAPESWYEPRPPNADAWRVRARVVPAQRPAALLGALTPALHGHGLSAKRLAAVVSGQGMVVTTGQQPGLFGGPLYTLSKAVCARAIADVLQERCGIPVAPVFWAATDDADATEAGRIAIATPSGAEMLEAPALAEPPGTPLCSARLGDVSQLFGRLEAAAGSASDHDILEAARSAYVASATVGGAYVVLLTHILSPLGVTVLDAGHPVVRARMAQSTDAALASAEAVAIALAARGDELRRAGHEPQVAELPDLSLVFDWTSGTKVRVPVAHAHDARAIAPELRSPNVLLRPIAERAILPTAAYVAGPGELAYFAQVSAVADALGQARPLVLPRWSGTIVEPRVSRLLERLDLTRADLDHPHRAARRIAERALTVDAGSALEAVKAKVKEIERQLLGLAGREPQSLSEAAARGHASRFQLAAQRLERRALAAAKRREDETMRMLAAASANLRPFGRPQERTLAFLPFVARHGSALTDAMYVAARAHAEALVGA